MVRATKERLRGETWRAVTIVGHLLAIFASESRRTKASIAAVQVETRAVVPARWCASKRALVNVLGACPCVCPARIALGLKDDLARAYVEKSKRNEQEVTWQM